MAEFLLTQTAISGFQNLEFADAFLKRHIGPNFGITLAEYGKKLLELKEKPNAIFIFVKPLMGDYPIYQEYIKRFTEFGKRVLKDRFVVTNYDYKTPERPFPRTVLTRLADSVTIKAFGEYQNECVYLWKSATEKIIRNTGRQVIAETLDATTIHSVNTDFGIKEKVKRRIAKPHRLLI